MVLPQGDGDAMVIERKAFEFAEYGIQDLSEQLRASNGAMIALGTLIYNIFGRSPFIFGLAIVLMGTFTVSYMYKASLLLWQNPKLSRRIAWFGALFPQMLLHSALLLREIPVNFFLCLAILSLIKFWKYRKRQKIFHFTLYILLGTLFHTGIITVFAAVLLAFLIVKQENRTRFQQSISRIFGILILVGGLAIMNSTGFGLNKFGGSIETIFEALEDREKLNTQGGAAFPEWMRIRGGTSELWKIPVRLVAFLFSPAIPFLVRSSGHLIGLIDAVLYLLLFYYIYRDQKYLKKNKAALTIFIITIVLCLVFSLGTSNFGTAIRHRAKMAPLLIILAINHRKWEKRNQINAMYNELKSEKRPKTLG